MAKNKEHKFLISDQTVNNHGFRIMTDGIDTTHFEKNPVAFWNHKVFDKYQESNNMPIGKWPTLEKKGEELIGYLVCDLKDEEGKKLNGKIEDGYVNACSLHVEPIEISSEPADMLPGQTLPTITKCILLEVSPVGLPGNYNAVKLRTKEGGSIQLNNETTSSDINKVFESINHNKISKKQIMEDSVLALKLGLDERATEEQINAKLDELNAASTEKTELQTKLDGMKSDRVKVMLDNAIEDKKIKADEREHYETLAGSNFDSTKAILDGMSAPPKIVDVLSGEGMGLTQAKSVAECEFMKLSQTDPNKLALMRKENPKRFEALQAEYLTLQQQENQG